MVHIKIQPRASGKTTDIIKKLIADKKSVMIVHSYEASLRLLKEYPKIDNCQILSYEKIFLQNVMCGTKYRTIYVDEIGIILAKLLSRQNITADNVVATHTNDEEFKYECPACGGHNVHKVNGCEDCLKRNDVLDMLEEVKKFGNVREYLLSLGAFKEKKLAPAIGCMVRYKDKQTPEQVVEIMVVGKDKYLIKTKFDLGTTHAWYPWEDFTEIE